MGYYLNQTMYEYNQQFANETKNNNYSSISVSWNVIQVRICFLKIFCRFFPLKLRLQSKSVLDFSFYSDTDIYYDHAPSTDLVLGIPFLDTISKTIYGSIQV